MPLYTVFHTGGLVWGRGKRQPMPLDSVFHTGGLVRGRGNVPYRRFGLGERKETTKDYLQHGQGIEAGGEDTHLDIGINRRREAQV